MKYHIIFILCMHGYFYSSNELIAYQESCLELEVIYKAVQADSAQKQQEILNNIQAYGYCCGRILVLILKSRQASSHISKMQTSWSLRDTENVAKIGITTFLIVVELIKMYQARKNLKSMISKMTYDDFVVQYPDLVIVYYHIMMMKKLIELSLYGSFPEQVFARIQLTKMSLPKPYDNFAQKAAKKMYKLCFDKYGRFVWHHIEPEHHPYKKFAKKVAQIWQDLIWNAELFPHIIAQQYESTYAQYIASDYNDTIILMIHAGMKENFSELMRLHQKYPDFLTTQIYHCYIS